MVYAGIVFADVESVEATGDMELTVTMSRPSVLLPGNLAIFAAGIVSPTALEAEGADFGQSPVGTGPFKFESWTKDVELVLVANDDYWGGRPALDRVVWRTIADDTVRLSELQTGSIDVANQIDFKDAPDIEGDENLQLITGPFLNVQFLAFNQAIPPFDNPSLRMAVQHAINKESIAEVVASGHYTLGAGPIAPTLLGYDPSLAERYPYDPAQAEALIAESGLTRHLVRPVEPGQLLLAAAGAAHPGGPGRGRHHGQPAIAGGRRVLRPAEHGRGAGVRERLDVGQRRPGQRDVLPVHARAGGQPHGIQERDGSTSSTWRRR